ncbi:glycosyltransferase family 61 protein [Microlunatus speluncae]|uniref:glycosyltransferase family 61 protein n=1 Tax=Microlunatus speluncae TaxID=2594267 RepID=UPI0012667E0F|nr:glycosyltransferase 61 family protein [Microlunatus speluncae]
MERSRQSDQPRRGARLKRLGRRYAPDWLKDAYRSARGGKPAPAGNGAATTDWVTRAVELGWQPDQQTRRFLKQAESALAKAKPKRVVVFTDRDSAAFGRLARQAWPAATVVQVAPADQDHDGRPDDRLRLVVGADDSVVHAELTALGPYQLIMDATLDPPAERLRRFRRVWFHLAARGRYIVRSVTAGLAGAADRTKAPSVWTFLSRVVDDQARGRYADIDGLVPSPAKDEQAIAESVRRIGYDDELLIITSTGPALPKLREWEIGRVFEARPELGRVLTRLPARSFARVGDLRCNHDRHDLRFATEYQVPEVQLREYDDVLAGPHQVLLSQELVLPDTFRHFTHPRLKSRFLDDLHPLFARYPRKLTDAKELSGSYFYLSSEWPRHFGHIMTEQLSRLWAWSIAKQRYPDLKALLPLPGGHNELAPFERDVLGAVGIPPEDFVSPKGVLRVERLLSATPMLVNPTYVHPELPAVWRRAGAHLIARAQQREWPAKVFISRRSNYKRACHNLSEVEEFFVRHGFTVLYPEDYDVAEQAMIFDSAELIAGFAGSALFSLIFCAEPKRVIMISSESYTARNEYMMAFAMGHRVRLVWCDPDIAQPEQGWDGKAFASGFSVDFDRDGEFLSDAATADW